MKKIKAILCVFLLALLMTSAAARTALTQFCPETAAGPVRGKSAPILMTLSAANADEQTIIEKTKTISTANMERFLSCIENRPPVIMIKLLRPENSGVSVTGLL